MKRAVLIACFEYWFPNRLEPIMKILEKEYEVDVIVSNYDHIRKQVIQNRYEDCKYIVVPQYCKNISLKRIFSHLYFGMQIGRYLKQARPDLVYALIPPNNVAYQCAKYKKNNPNCRYTVDVIDLWPESFPNMQLYNNPLFNIWACVRNKNIKTADNVFIECNFYKEVLKSVLAPSKIHTLFLYKEQSYNEKLDVIRVRKEWKKRKNPNYISLGYIGSINNIIDVDAISKMITFLYKMGKTISIEVIGDGERRKILLDCMRKAGAVVSYHGKLFDEKMKIEILGSCDFGINMMISDIAVGLTTKSIDYFSVGLPIINNIKGDTWRLVKSKKVGVNIESEHSFTELLNANIEDMGENAMACYEKYFTKEAFLRKFRQGMVL